jgi:heme A synthase
MVKSGLVDDPRVSQFRLTAHLGLALLIFAAMLWIALDLLFPRRNSSPTRAGAAALALVVVVFLMSLTGGFVAGIRAGKAYNTFPLMNGVCPGSFPTPMNAAVFATAAGQGVIARAIPMRRLGDPAELGPTIVFLASEASSFMTGSVLTVDGGQSLT